MQAPQPASPFVEPWRPTPRGTFITAIVITVVVVLSVVTVVVQRIWFTPGSVVDGYYAALADRDAQQALTYGGNGDTAAGNLIASNKYVPPTNVKIGKIENGGDDHKSKDERVAKVSFTIGDKKLDGQVELHRKRQLTWGLFRGWELSSDLPGIDVNTPVPVDVQVNGQALPKTDDGASRHVGVFPGRYVVGVADNPLIEADPVTVDAGFGDSTADLAPRIKAEAKAAVDTQVKAYLKNCLVAANKPDNTCPFSLNSEITRPVWRIATYPTIELRLADDGSVVAESSTEGKATLTGVGYGGYPVNDDSTFRISGLVTVEQGAIKFQPEQ